MIQWICHRLDRPFIVFNGRNGEEKEEKRNQQIENNEEINGGAANP